MDADILAARSKAPASTKALKVRPSRRAARFSFSIVAGGILMQIICDAPVLRISLVFFLIFPFASWVEQHLPRTLASAWPLYLAPFPHEFRGGGLRIVYQYQRLRPVAVSGTRAAQLHTLTDEIDEWSPVYPRFRTHVRVVSLGLSIYIRNLAQSQCVARFATKCTCIKGF